MRTLTDKVVVVTGAGSGIGRAVALAVARRGALVAVSDVDETGLAETVDRLKGLGAEVHSDRLDVADRAAFAAYAEAVAAHFGRVNVVVNNAGVTMTGHVLQQTYDEIEWITGVNYWGVVHGTKELLPHLIASGEGHVVNISSLFGLVSMPGQSAYNATKYAVRGFTEALREEMLIEGHPVARLLRAPRRHQDRDQPQRPQERRPGRGRAGRAVRDEAGPDVPGEGRRGDRPRHPQGQGAGPRRARRARDAPRRPCLGSRYQDLVARASRRVLPPGDAVPPA